MHPLILKSIRAVPSWRRSGLDGDVSPRQLQSSFWALFDQAIVSAGNFATNILIARFSDSNTYGKFALCLAGMFFLNSLHYTLIVYPLSMSISTGEDSSKPILATSLVLTLASCLCLAILAGPYLSSVGGAGFAMLTALALFAWQAQETCRRAMMARLHTWQTVLGDFVSYPGQAILIYAAALHQQRITLPAVFVCMAATSLAGAVIQYIQVRPPVVVHNIFTVAKNNWTLGRWPAASALLFTLPNLGFLAVLGLRFGAPAAAGLQSLFNIVRLVHPVMFGISNAILPRVAEAHVRTGARSAARVGISMGLHGGVLVGPYLLFVMIAPSYMLNLFYGGHSSYLPLQNTLRVVAFAYVYVYTAIVLGNVLNALGRPRIPFNGLLAGFTVSVTLGLPLAAVAGVPGAAAAVLFDGAARCVPQAFALRRVMRECPR